MKEGYGYAVYRDDDIVEFPSGTKAMLADAVYYRMRVESRLTDSETHESMGAHVKYIATRAERYSLPMPGANEYDMSSSYQYWVTGLPLDKIDEMFIDQPLNIEQIGTPEARWCSSHVRITATPRVITASTFAKRTSGRM